MSFLRSLAERLMRDRVVKRRMPAEFGALPILVSSAGGLRKLFRPLDQTDGELLQTVRNIVRKGDTVWDFGANLGVFSVAASGLAGASGRVISFEPDAVLVSLLRRSCAMQPAHAAALTVVPCGVAGAPGLRTFMIASRARASNSLAEYGNTQTGGVRETQTIMCLSTDQCLEWLPPPAALKIDIEGAELEVLRNSNRLLAEVRPVIAIEVAQGNSGEIASLLRGHGYALFDGAKQLAPQAETQGAPWNTIAIPREKLALYAPAR